MRLLRQFIHLVLALTSSRTPNDENIRNIIEHMINMLDSRPAPNPYHMPDGQRPNNSLAPNNSAPMLVLCASEVVKTLEILSPQAIHSAYGSDPVMRELGYAFQATSRPNTRFDMLKQELLQQIEPGTSAKDIHPCAEAWTEFHVDGNGTVIRLETASSAHEGLASDSNWTLPQQAAFRLCIDVLGSSNDRDFAIGTRWDPSSTLTELFQQQMIRCQADTQTVDFMYWKKAMERMHRDYPSTRLLDDDSPVLNGPLQYVQSRRLIHMNACNSLEDRMGSWESAYQHIRKNVKRFMSGLDELRLKLWYTSEIINSPLYADARSIAAALSYMSRPDSRPAVGTTQTSRASLRPGSSRSGVSSIFGQRRNDTIQLLKAPSDQGGSRKLADGQIEIIKRWLRQYNIDNFCKGEERLHRFCMEIQLVAKRLTGDNIVESEVLWSSTLFQRERSFYDYSPYGISSAPASTRPVSIMSDSFSATYPMMRPATRSSDSDIRSTMSDERGSFRRESVYGMFARSLNPQLLTPELASSMCSHGRASSTTTTASEIFSTPSQSVTEASVYSRPPSTLYGRLPNFAISPTFSLKEKRRFREQLRKGLVCLLLSDLGCIVWSWGCETDAWISNAQNNTDVMSRCAKRILTKSLHFNAHKDGKSVVSRRRSTTETVKSEEQMARVEMPEPIPLTDQDLDDTYLPALRDILDRLSQHIDPISKLQACHDFDTMALQQLEWLKDRAREPQKTSSSERRRKSLDSRAEGLTGESLHRLSHLSLTGTSQPSDDQIVHHYKQQLAVLRPKTIFRDLQYIAVFTPSEMLDKTPAGKAFTHLGMAALDYKNELCGSMVDIADRTMASDLGKRAPANSDMPTRPLSNAAEYWMIAAVEGNAVAQRELAMLYLLQPEMLPILTRPLWSAGDVFREENMWQKPKGGSSLYSNSNNNNRQALCLALHWMQQAANNGDEIARRKLEERKGLGNSIR